MIYVILYLVAIVTANWLVSRFGASVSVICAFLFIGFNLTCRDKLHDAWSGRHLKRNMFLLIAGGSLLSIPFNAGRIAAASFAAFALSEIVDAIAYHLMLSKSWTVRANVSNMASGLVDSIAFPLFAFGWPPLVGIMTGQFIAKCFGGALWSLVIKHIQQNEVAIV